VTLGKQSNSSRAHHAEPARRIEHAAARQDCQTRSQGTIQQPKRGAASSLASGVSIAERDIRVTTQNWLKQPRQVFWPMLSIAIKPGDDVKALPQRIPKPDAHRRANAHSARQPHPSNAKSPDDVLGVIRRPVVDNENFDVV
jgi:hypothetical protein